MTTAERSADQQTDRSPTNERRDGDGATAEAPVLSVVVVTYNEVDRVADCLGSIADACADVPSFEVILVDSNSEDGTVGVATDYEATVLRITDDSLTTPGAGRYVGTRHAAGEYLLYVDGDMVLEEGWVAEAIDRLQRNPDLAGVDGYLNECNADRSAAVDYLHGVALYDRDAIEAVGGYHPFLEAWEDVDLGFELRLAGYELERLPIVTAHHPVASSPFEQFRRWRRGYYKAGGQVCRKALTEPPLLARWLRHFGDKFVAFGWLLAGIVALVVAPLLVIGWLGATAAGVTALCARMGVENGLQRALSFLLFPAGFVLGFRSLPPRESFPMDAVETVQRLRDRTAVAANAD